MFSGLRVTSRLALLHDFIQLFRRMALLYVAMFLPEQPWLQLMTLLCCSLLKLTYLSYVRPFESILQARVHVMNELIMLLVAYLVTCVAIYLDSSTEIGAMIMYIIWASWLSNGLVLVYLITTEVYYKLRRLYLRHKAKHQATKLSKPTEKSD